MIGGDSGHNNTALEHCRLLVTGDLPILVKQGKWPVIDNYPNCPALFFLHFYVVLPTWLRPLVYIDWFLVREGCIKSAMTSVGPRYSGAEANTTSANDTGASTLRQTKGIERGIEDDGIDAGTEKQQKQSVLLRAWKIVTWTPPNCRWDPDKPPQFSMSSTLKSLQVLSLILIQRLLITVLFDTYFARCHSRV